MALNELPNQRRLRSNRGVPIIADHVPEDQNALKAALIQTRAKLSSAEALIEHLQLVIAKMRRELFGRRSERSQRLLDQLELQLEEMAPAGGRGCHRTLDPRQLFVTDMCGRSLAAGAARRSRSRQLPSM